MENLQTSNSVQLPTNEEIALLAAQIKRERQLEGYRRGGRFKGTVRSRTVAKQTIESTRPWESSTGPKSIAGKQRVSQNNRYYFSIEFSAPTSDELDRACLPICEALDRFHSEMKRLSLGNVTIIRTESIEGVATCSNRSSLAEARSALESGIIFLHRRKFAVRVSGASLEDRAAIDTLWLDCQSE